MEKNIIDLLRYLVAAYKVQIYNGSMSNGLATAHYHRLIDEFLNQKSKK